MAHHHNSVQSLSSIKVQRSRFLATIHILWLRNWGMAPLSSALCILALVTLGCHVDPADGQRTDEASDAVSAHDSGQDTVHEDTASEDTASEEEDIPSYQTASCDDSFVALDLSGKPEGQGDFAIDLERLSDLTEAQRMMRFATDSLSPFFREVIAYSLMIPVGDLNEIAIADLLDGPYLAQGVALAFIEGDGRRPDINLLRRSLHRFYYCEREVPLYLEDVRLIAGEMDPQHVIDIEESTPKAHSRFLTANLEGTLMFAETIADGEVRETEVLWQGRRPDGALEFLVYDDQGRLQDGSFFATSEGPETPEAAPYACMACHRDIHNGSGFTVTFP